VPNAALRFTPPQKPQKEDPGSNNLLFKILPHPPRPEPTPHEEANLKSKDQRVWVLREGQLTPVAFTKGLSDGKMTEVAGGAIEAGMEVVTDMATAK